MISTGTSALIECETGFLWATAPLLLSAPDKLGVILRLWGSARDTVQSTQGYQSKYQFWWD